MLDLEYYVDYFATNLHNAEEIDEEDLIFEGAYETIVEEYGPQSPWYSAIAEEVDLQKLFPHVVLQYWASMGGRCQATGFEMYHVYRIVSEEKRHFEVQWIGYSDTDTSWEPKGKVRKICPAAIIAWKTRCLD
ncbi:hypothetical protein FHETE_5844 [Fusarium heterosporum]|uniref:Chromo domain-containing protein n=1 Tax=Fusarium heterosporum TaxID=42747 RepID=A0A8H5WP86_FUSHE|nr:hypothetical protein FHETE_5844 [Fusarium heterosporum]